MSVSEHEQHELVAEEESSAVEVPVEFAGSFSDIKVHEEITVTELEDNIQRGEDETMLDTDMGQEANTGTGLIVNGEVFSEKPPVRRSGHERRKPEWLRGGDFVVSQQNVSLKFPDWERRCEFLTNLITIFQNQEERILNVILQK